MVDNIAANVLTKEQIPVRKNKFATTTDEATAPEPIRLTSSFEIYADLVHIIQKFEPHQKGTMSFHHSQSTFCKSSSKSKKTISVC